MNLKKNYPNSISTAHIGEDRNLLRYKLMREENEEYLEKDLEKNLEKSIENKF